MILNYYSHYKEKTKDKLLNAYRYEFLLNNNVEMFKHTFNSTDIKISRFMVDGIEYKLNIHGVVGFFIYENELLCEPVFFIGNRNNLGMPKDAYIILNNNQGKQILFKNWLDNNDIIIMKNNKLATTDNDIQRLANYEAEIEKSYYCNIINSRLAPIIQVQNPKDKTKIKTILENIYDGKPQSIDLTPSLIDNDEQMKLHNVTDVDDSSKIQYLDLANESLQKRYYQENGVNLNSSVKQAQQSIAEINDGSNSAYIYPSNKLQARCDCIEEFKDKFNISYSCEFSTCWKQGWKYLEQEVEQEVEQDEKGSGNNGVHGERPTNKSESNGNNRNINSGSDDIK